MLSSDVLIVVEDWISEYFFIIDVCKEFFQKFVLDCCKQWDGEDVLMMWMRFIEWVSKFVMMLVVLYFEDFDEVVRVEVVEQVYEELLCVFGYLIGEFCICCDGLV